MKLYTATLLLVTTLIAFTACKKEHKCKCYSPSLNSSVSFNIEGSKSDAKDECEQQPITGGYTGTDFQCHLD